MADCIAATGSLVMVGCGRWNGGGKIVWGLRMVWGAVEDGGAEVFAHEVKVTKSGG